MSDVMIKKFCALCGQTRNLKNKRVIKKLYVMIDEEKNDLGYMCDRCYKHLEQGLIFSKPKK